MYNSAVLLGIFAIFCLVHGQQGPCITINGGQGQCKSINNCAPLSALLNKKNRTPQDLDILRRSQCGFEDKFPAVCCPGRNERLMPSKPRCYTPEGKPGECVGVSSCPSINNMITPPLPKDTELFVKRSRCIGSDKHSVCCGPVPTFKEVKKGKCAASVSAFPPDPKTECCGKSNSFGNKIIGGKNTQIDEYPWLALIDYVDGQTMCGGALISGKYVLTAGHCVAGRNAGKATTVTLGDYDITKEGPDCVPADPEGMDCTSGEIRIPIERTIPHPHYNPLHPNKRNDIALVRLAKMAPFTDFIKPICLPTLDVTKMTTFFNLTAAGWGAVSKDQHFSNVKQDVQLQFVNQAECQSAYTVPTRKVQLWRGQLCAGGEEGKDSCKGDSGGPLMYRNERSTYEAIGVVSFGAVPCGMENIPGVYTNVYEYDTWIRSNIYP